MALGNTNVPGVSYRTLADAVEAMILGEPTTQLSTRNGEGICTRDGEEIMLRAAQIKEAVSFQEMRQEIVGEVMMLQRQLEQARASCMAAVESLAGQIVAGRVSTPLTARSGEELLTRSGAQIGAVRITKNV